MSNEVVLIGGYPASGKTRQTQQFVDKKYVRLNRDTAGGSLAELLPKLEIALSSKQSVVLDNLYCTKDSRSPVIRLAKKYNVPVQFMEMGTTLEDAQFNACMRMIDHCGRVLHPDDFRVEPYKNNPSLFPVAVLYKYRKEYEKPTLAEGFDKVTSIPFKRIMRPEWVNKAVILDADGTVRDTTNGAKFPTDPSHVKVLSGRREKLLEYQKQGYLLLGASNQSGIAKGDFTNEQAKACFHETNRQLGLDIPWSYCPHKVPPITCYCRKPGPAMGVEMIMKYNLDPRQTFYVGDMTTDKSFAGRCGFKFVDQNEFFK